jgi:hypothetical protein
LDIGRSKSARLWDARRHRDEPTRGIDDHVRVTSNAIGLGNPITSRTAQRSHDTRKSLPIGLLVERRSRIGERGMHQGEARD